MSNVYGIQWAILGGAKIQIVEAKFFPTNNFNGILSMLPSSPRETCCTINEEHSYFVFRQNFTRLFIKSLESSKYQETTSRSVQLFKFHVSPINASRLYSCDCFTNTTYANIADERSEVRSYVKKISGNKVELVHGDDKLRRVEFPKDSVTVDVPYLADLTHFYFSNSVLLVLVLV